MPATAVPEAFEKRPASDTAREGSKPGRDRLVQLQANLPGFVADMKTELGLQDRDGLATSMIALVGVNEGADRGTVLKLVADRGRIESGRRGHAPNTSEGGDDQMRERIFEWPRRPEALPRKLRRTGYRNSNSSSVYVRTLLIEWPPTF
jgi:hypothetical protein